MSNSVPYDGLVHVLRTAASRVKAGAAELGRLDSAVGDGDHGIAMTRAKSPGAPYQIAVRLNALSGT